MADVSSMVVSAARSAAMAEKSQEEVRERDRRAQELVEQKIREEAEAENRRQEEARQRAIEEASRGQNLSEVV
jgi:hypothetical protein